eukprot:m.160323 g.160323  ORF g.160323 m.160323 type:complete len:238 (-) comp14347_c3_seq2:1782-2495(-)
MAEMDQDVLLQHVEVDLEEDMGSIAAPTEDESTLDEPVWDTVKRDLFQVLRKFFHVFVPHSSDNLLRDWDLWGPMMLAMTLALLLRGSAADAQKTQVFTGVFFIVCAGACVVTLNNQLLGGTLSFFQGLCVVGYCILPLVVSCILLRFIAYLTTHIAVRLIVVTAAMGWSIFASYGFVAGSSPQSRRTLVVYPLVLFYLFVAWLIVNDVMPGHHVDPTPGVTTTVAATVTSTAATNQ